MTAVQDGDPHELYERAVELYGTNDETAFSCVLADIINGQPSRYAGCATSRSSNGALLFTAYTLETDSNLDPVTSSVIDRARHAGLKIVIEVRARTLAALQDLSEALYRNQEVFDLLPEGLRSFTRGLDTASNKLIIRIPQQIPPTDASVFIDRVRDLYGDAVEVRTFIPGGASRKLKPPRDPRT